MCAPILRRKIAYWLTKAVPIPFGGTVVTSTEAPFSATAKIGSGYDAPLITLRGTSWVDFVANAKAALGDAEGEAFAKTVYAKAFGSIAGQAEAQAEQVVQSTFGGQPIAPPQAPLPSNVTPFPTVPQPGQAYAPAPQAAAPAPPGAAYPGDCQHGQRTFKDSNTKNGQWRRWECAMPYARETQQFRCKAINA